MTDASAPPSRAPETAVTPRLIATDLDGTLLHDDKTVSDRTIAALAAAERAGLEVFFVTGRPARWMGVVSDHVHGHGLAICANGAAVVDLHRGGRIVEVSPWSGPPPARSWTRCAAPRPAPRSRSSGPAASTTSRSTRRCSSIRRRSSPRRRSCSPTTSSRRWARRTPSRTARTAAPGRPSPTSP
ncbi:HAD hydrolase family protein [Streptomyces lydicamycinicus]|nr:HAD hydrolase family protein [Streptomyces lydicamycinicus]